MSKHSTIGDRIADLRDYRGLTQEQLAERSGVSVDTIQKLEQNVRLGARITTLEKLARALDIELPRLLGQLTTTADLPDGGGLLELRNAVQDTAVLPGVPWGDTDEDAPALSDLRSVLATARTHYERGEYTELTTTLPALVRDLQATTRETLGGTAEYDDAWGMTAATHLIVADVASQLGRADLAFTAVERALTASQRASDPLREAMAVSALSLVLLRQGRWDKAQAVAERKAHALAPRFGVSTSEEVAVYGLLLLTAAVPAARGSRAQQATEMLTQAKAAAVLAGGEIVRVRSNSFSVFSVAMQATTAALSGDDADPAAALEHARDVRLNRLPWPISRARHQLDIAHAQYQLGNLTGSLHTLLKVEEEQPEWIRHQVLATDTVRELQEAERRRNPELRRLAARLRVDQEASSIPTVW